MNPKRCYLLSLWLVIFLGAAAAPAADPDQEGPRTVQLRIVPAAESVPVLRYRLLPGILDQKPGNGAQLYYRAAHALPDKFKEDILNQVESWRDMPTEQLPRDQVHKTLNQLHSALQELRSATIRETCHWEMPLEDGFSMLLPSLSEFRNLARILSLQTRLRIAEGDMDQALTSLQMGFALGRDVGQGPTLIQGLVGVAIGAIMLEEVEHFIQAPDAPNLYWALAALPSPYVNMQRSIELESTILPIQFPLLQQIDRTRFSVEQAREMWNNLLGLFNMAGVEQPDAPANLLATGIVMVGYPEAKRALIEQGRSPEEIEAMPAGQVTLIYQYQTYQQYIQDINKWFYMPYWQARAGLAKADEQLQAHRQSLRNQMLGMPFMQLLPALNRVYFIQARMERRIAALECVEAIRMYAAGHDGALPGNLADIQEVPVPIDPMTGGKFDYHVEDGRAILAGPAVPGQPAKEGFRYEITVARGG